MGVAPSAIGNASGLEPAQEFKFAIKTKNLAMMEHALGQLQYQVDKITFLDRYVEVSASRGSEIAGKILIDNMQEFIDSPDTDFHQKMKAINPQRAEYELSMMSGK